MAVKAWLGSIEVFNVPVVNDSKEATRRIRVGFLRSENEKQKKEEIQNFVSADGLIGGREGKEPTPEAGALD